MGSRPSFGRRPASQGKIVQETKPCPTGARQKAWRRRDRGAPPAFGSGASRTRFHAHGQQHTARLWHWGVLAGQMLAPVPSLRGGRRVVPVAGHVAAVAGASRRDGTRPLLLHEITGRSPVPKSSLAPGQNDAARVRPPGSTARRDATRVPHSPPAQEAWREGQLTHIPAQEVMARRPNVPPSHARRQRAPGEGSPAGLG
jgi:hypothetical protein